MPSDQDEENNKRPSELGEAGAAASADASSQEMLQPRRRRRRRSPSPQISAGLRGPYAVQPVPPDSYIRRSLGSLTCCPDDSDVRRRLSEPPTAPNSAGAPLNLTGLLLYRHGMVRPKPNCLASFARQRPSDKDRRLVTGLAAVEAGGDSALASSGGSVYLSMLTCSFEFCHELFALPAPAGSDLPQVGSAMILSRTATTWGKYLGDDPATFAVMDQARWPVRGLCVVSDAYVQRLDSLMDDSGGLLEGRAFLMQRPHRRLLGMRFGRPPPGFRPVELVDVRAERHEVLAVEEPGAPQPQQPASLVVEDVDRKPDFDKDSSEADAASSAPIPGGGASVFGKLLAMLNVKASAAAEEPQPADQWDDLDAGADCIDNPDVEAAVAGGYGFDDEQQLLRLQQRSRHESEGGGSRGLHFSFGYGGQRGGGGGADEEAEDDEEEEGDGEEAGGSSGDESGPGAPLSVEEFSSQRALADYRLNELVSGLLASTSDRQFEGLWLARPWPHLRLLLVVEPPSTAAAAESDDEESLQAERGRRVDLFLLTGYAQFCDKRVRRMHALLKRAAPDLRLPPTPEPLSPGLIDFDQLHERGVTAMDLLRWRLLPYELSRCVAFVLLCCASMQPSAGCPFCSDSGTPSGADDVTSGASSARRRRLRADESDGLLRELTAHVMAKHTKLLRCHLCEGCNLFSNQMKLIQHLHYQHGLSDTGVHPCETCGKEFPSQFRLRAHQINVHPTESHPCSVCGRHFKRVYLLRNHMAAVHKEPLSAVPSAAAPAAEVWDEMACEVCKKVFSSERLLNVHRQRVHAQTTEGRTFHCPHCLACLKGKQNLATHIRQIHESPRVTKECPVCQKQVRNLSDHVISQHKVRLKDLKVDCHDVAADAYQCGACALSFHMQHLLLQHRRASHPQLTCHSCGRIFVSSEAAEEHLLICTAPAAGGPDGERKRKRKAAAAAAAAAAASSAGESGGSRRQLGFKAPLPVAGDPGPAAVAGSSVAVGSSRRTKRTARRRQQSEAAAGLQPQQRVQEAAPAPAPSASLKRKSRQPKRRSISSSVDSTASDRRADEVEAVAADGEDAAAGTSESPVQEAKRQRQRGKVLRKRRARTSAASVAAVAAAAATASSDEDSVTAAKTAALADDDEVRTVPRRQQQKRKPAAEAEAPGLCFSQDADSEDSDSLQQQLMSKRRLPTSEATAAEDGAAATEAVVECPAADTAAPSVESVGADQ